MSKNFKEIRKKLKNLNRRVTAAFIALVLTVTSVGVFCIIQARADSYVDAGDIPAIVEFNGNMYSKTNPYVILEIVPDVSVGTLGYMVGGDSMPVRKSDLEKLYAAVAAKGGNVAEVKKKMSEKLSQSCYFVDKTAYDGGNYVNEYGDIPKYQDRNILAHMIFADSDNITDAQMYQKYTDMSDKMLVRTVKDTEITYDDIRNANFVFMNPQSHVGNLPEAYNQMADYCTQYGLGKATGLSQDYVRTAYNKTLKIRSDIALYMYIRNVKENMAIVMDWAPALSEKDTGLYHLAMLELGIEQEQFVEEYAQTTTSDELAGTYACQGALGNVYATATTMTVYKNDGTVVPWHTEMFFGAAKPDEVLNGVHPYYPYYTATTYPYTIHNNFFSYMGDNIMDFHVKSDSQVGTAQMDVEGFDFDRVKDIFGTTRTRDCLRYIMGVYADNNIGDINVLEIQPWGKAEYNNYDGAGKILTIFGITGDIDNKVSESLQDGTNQGRYVISKKGKEYTVNIRSMSINAFNGMTENIKAQYDLVIIGSYNPDNYINTSYGKNTGNTGKLITDEGANINGVKINSKNGNTYSTEDFSGNDFTDKAYEKLYEYARAGLPLFESQEVYTADSAVIDRNKEGGGDTNIYKLCRIKLNERLNAEGTASSNITTVADNSTESNFKVRKVLKFPTRAEFSIISPTAYDNSSGGGASTTIKVSDVKFTIRADSLIPSGSRVKLYIDRNADALYNEVISGNMRELYADYTLPQITAGQTYDITLNGTIPDDWFGYFKFKIEITTLSGAAIEGVSNAVESAFALKPNSTKTVKVLQIYNATASENYTDIVGTDAVTTLQMDSDEFRTCFNAIKSVTGMNLQVTTMKVQDFERKMDEDAAQRAVEPEYEGYLAQFSIVVIGFRDSYGKSGRPFQSQTAIDAVDEYIADNKSVLFTHDTMAYQKQGDSASEPLMTKQVSTSIGMQGSRKYTNSLFMKLHGGYTSFNDVPHSGSTRMTNNVDKLNWGQVTEYPYKIDDRIDVEDTHGQFYRLNLENIDTLDGDGNVLAGVHNSEVTVWYTLGGKASGNNDAKFFYNSGQDAFNNYYIYSKGNVTYTSAGHSSVTDATGMEMKLFVNTLIRSIIVATLPPKVEITNGVNVESNEYDITARPLVLGPDGNPIYDEDGVGGAVTPTAIPLEFVATAPDLVIGDPFKNTKIFVDINNNGKYDSATDLVLAEFNNTIKNGDKNLVDLYALASARGAATASQVVNLYTQNKLRIGILVTDNAKSTGQAYGNYLRRNYFELD